MTRLSVRFPNPRIVAAGILREALPDTVQVGTIDPAKRPADKQGLPYVRLSIDSRTGFYPVTATAALRVQVWADTEIATEDLAEVCKAILLSYLGDANTRGFREGVGPLPTTDPDSGTPLAYFTAAMHLRPIPLTS